MESTFEVGSIFTRPSMLRMMQRVPSTTTLHILWAVLFSFRGMAFADEWIRMTISNDSNDWLSLDSGRPGADPEIFWGVRVKLEKQKVDAAIWRDTCLEYFRQFSPKPMSAPR
jgi:alpha-glucuronidase